jgi:hypothetical protein
MTIGDGRTLREKEDRDDRMMRSGVGWAALVAAAIIVAAVTQLAAGCASFVDLGPQATLRDAALGDDSSTNDEPPVPDSAPAHEASFACGLTPHPNPKCNACAVGNCCALGLQCAADPTCVQGTQCSLDCVFDATCVGQCVSTYGTDGGIYVTYQDCVISHCTFDCLPGPVCSQLARCCLTIQDPSTRELCAGAVNASDENGCIVVVTNVLRPQLGGSFCPAIGHAGAADAGDGG